MEEQHDGVPLHRVRAGEGLETFLYTLKAGPAGGSTPTGQGRLIRSAERGAKFSGVPAEQLPVPCLEEHLARRGVKHDPPHIQTDDSPVR